MANQDNWSEGRFAYGREDSFERRPASRAEGWERSWDRSRRSGSDAFGRDEDPRFGEGARSRDRNEPARDYQLGDRALGSGDAWSARRDSAIRGAETRSNEYGWGGPYAGGANSADEGYFTGGPRRDFYGRDQELRDRGGEGGDFGHRGAHDRDWETSGRDDAAARRRLAETRFGEHRGRGPKDYTRSDERIREDVNDRLTDDPHLDASGITVAVKDGEVTLSGLVPNRRDKRHAEDLAEAVSGAKHVQNNLRVHDKNYDASVAAAGGTNHATPTASSNALGGRLS